MSTYKKTLFSVIFTALMTALEIVFSRFLSLSLWNTKIGFSFLPVLIAAAIFGPVCGAAVGGLGDLLGAVLFPIGPYFPGFTVTAALTGLVFGLVFKNGITPVKTVIAVLSTELVFTLLVNSLWISILYGAPYKQLLITRCLQAAIMAVVKLPMIFLIIKPLSLQIKRLIFKPQNIK